LDGVDPLAPIFPVNTAKVVSRLTRKPAGGKVAVVLRSCEIRAFIELVKLKQGYLDEVVIIGIDCLGAYKNTDYFKFVGEDVTESTKKFYQSVLSGKEAAMDGVDLATACKACEYPVPDSADIIIGLFGMDTNSQLLVQAKNSKGEELLARLDLPDLKEPQARLDAIKSLIAQRTDYRDKMFAETTSATCKECVFVTDVFNHEPSQYLKWAIRKGAIKMPTDTVFYHITRLAHMSTACIGCGQCSNACPNDIPVMELFRTIAQRTQKAFEYEAGRSIEDDPPLSVFMEDELADVVGI
jgi:formate dehydrogenase subunit beta